MAQSRSPSDSPSPFRAAEISSEMRKRQIQDDEQEQQSLGSLPEDALVEILSRVPYMSLCRFKCVSKPWLALCSAPDIRKRSPQTLSGFFHRRTYAGNICFYNLNGRSPPLVDASLPFLRRSYQLVFPRHCCDGLVLCRCWKSYPRHGERELPHDAVAFEREAGYSLVVCNPATEKWTELPPCPIEETTPERKEQYLGFDPAIPSRFVVFAHLWECEEVTIYSSDTGRWTTVQSGWTSEPVPIGPPECVFLNGTMYLVAHKPSLVTVDTEGKVWREIDIPGLPEGSACPSIGQSQGRLYAWYVDNPNVCQLSVWALEDYDTEKWTLKHTVNILELFGRHCCRDSNELYTMSAIHPDRNLIFLTDGKKTISYDMDNRDLHVICTSKSLRDVQPYIPCFADWPSDGH